MLFVISFTSLLLYIYIIFFVRRFWFGSIDLEKKRFITKWLNKFSNNIMFWLSVAKTHESKRHVLKPPLYNNSLSIGDKNFNATFKSELLGCLSTCWHLRTSDCAKLSVQPWNVIRWWQKWYDKCKCVQTKHNLQTW